MVDMEIRRTMLINNIFTLHRSLKMAFLGMALLIASPFCAANTVTASLDKQSVIENEVIQLTIRADFSDTGSGPDFSALKKNFDILNQSQSSQFRFNLGTSQSIKFWIISLMPKSTGTVEIPPIKVGDYYSNPLTLKVKTSPALLDENGNPPVMIEMQASDLQPYLQQEVVLSLKIYNAFALQNANISTPKNADLVMEKLIDDQVGFETIKGTEYQVLTRKYLAFPQRSGEIEIDPQTIAAMVNTNRGRRLIKAQSSPIKLNVLPVPANYPSENWLPAKSVTISSKLAPSNGRQAGNAKVGDTLIWTITTSADGAYPEQIAPLNFTSTRDYKLYPQPPVFDSTRSEDGIVGKQTITIEVVPTAPGTLTLPEIEVPYWDIKNKLDKYAHAPSPTMQITGLPIIEEAPVKPKGATALLKPQTRSVAPIALDKPEEEQQAQSDSDKRTKQPVDLTINDKTPTWSLRNQIVIGLLAITLISLLAAVVLKLKKKKPRRKTYKDDGVPTLLELAPLTTADEKTAYKNLIEICESDQIKLLRSSLLEWGRHRWGDQVKGLDDIKHLSQSEDLSQLLMEAELVMYSDQASTEWDGSNLAEALKEFYSGETKPSQESQLKSLYPDL